MIVPTLSYRAFLNAPQWGKFHSIQNRIPVKMDLGVKVTSVLEDEYQDMLRADALEEEARLAAQEEAVRSVDEEAVMFASRRVTRGEEQRAATNRNFAALFDGAQIQTGNEGGGTRIFLNPEEGVELTSILYKGEEIIDKLEGNSILLPAGSNGSLEIRTNYVEKPVLVEIISLSETTLTLNEKETAQLTVTVTPDDATDKNVKWESSNPDVATVSDDGLIEAISEGICTVTASTLDGSDLSASCEVTVDKESGILNVSIDGVKVRREGTYIYVAGVKAGEAVGLYNLAGVHCSTVISDGSEVRFEATPAQYYIVRVGKASIKVRL